jgi:hypothetical protein
MAEAAAVAAVVAVVATVVSAGVGTYAAVSSAEAAKDSSKFNADVARNKALAEQQKASFEATQIKRRNLLRLGSQRASLAKAGITIESGDDVVYDTAIQGELDVMSALYGGNSAATYYQSKAKLSKMEGDNAATAGYLKAGGSVVGGAKDYAALKIK